MIKEIHPAKSDAQLVAWLKELLDQAEKGDLIGFAYVAAFRGKGTYEIGLQGDAYVHQVMVGLDVLKYRLLQKEADR